MVKKKLTLSVNEDIINQAKELEINLSAFLEIRLSDYIRGNQCSHRESTLIVQCPPNINSIPLHHNQQEFIKGKHFHIMPKVCE